MISPLNYRRIVITGLGALTPIGYTVSAFWQNLIKGKSSGAYIRNSKQKYIDNIPEKEHNIIGAIIKEFDGVGRFGAREEKKMDLYAQYAMATAEEAISDSNLDFTKEDTSRIACIIGSGIGGIYTLQSTIKDYINGRRLSPFFVPKMIINMASALIAIKYGLQGNSYCVTSACATGAHSIALAFDNIKSDYSDIAIAGGSEAPFGTLAMAGFASMRALTKRYDSPQTASRPFDKYRDGFLMGEGSGTVVLEELEHAQKRNAKIYAEIIGYGASTDAYHITAPEPEGNGVIIALKQALKNARISPQDISHINTHGTSTQLGDAAETLAIKRVFGHHAYNISLNSIKSMTGHMLGAAGIVEAIACILAIYNEMIPPTINYTKSDPLCDLDYTVNKAKKRSIHYALNNAFGFGGHNASLVFKKYE